MYILELIGARKNTPETLTFYKDVVVIEKFNRKEAELSAGIIFRRENKHFRGYLFRGNILIKTFTNKNQEINVIF